MKMSALGSQLCGLMRAPFSYVWNEHGASASKSDTARATTPDMLDEIGHQFKRAIEGRCSGELQIGVSLSGGQTRARSKQPSIIDGTA